MSWEQCEAFWIVRKAVGAAYAAMLAGGYRCEGIRWRMAETERPV